MSGGSSSLNLSSSSTGVVGVSGAPAIADGGSTGSRSSSVRSVRRTIPKQSSRPNTTLAHLGSRNGSTSRPMEEDSPIVEGPMYQQVIQTYVPTFEQETNYQQLNQVYVASTLDHEVVNQAAAAVMRAQTEVHSVQTEAQRYVGNANAEVQQVRTEAQLLAQEAQSEIRQVQTEAQRIISQTEARAQQDVASTKVSAAQALMEQDQRLRAEFRVRERALMDEVQKLKDTLASSRQNLNREQLRLNGTDLSEIEAKITLLMDKMIGFQESLSNLETRVVALENWGTDTVEEITTFEEEEELVPGTNQGAPPIITFEQNQPRISSPVRSGHVRMIAPTFHAGDDEDNQVLNDPQSPEDYLRWKDVSIVKMPALPDSAGSFRSWRNAFLPMLMALDSSPENFLYFWLLSAFNARSTQETQVLKQDSEGFPRFDRILCSCLTKDLRGHFGARIQSYVEECIATNTALRGRPLLNMVVREFDLDAALGGVEEGLKKGPKKLGAPGTSSEFKTQKDKDKKGKGDGKEKSEGGKGGKSQSKGKGIGGKSQGKAKGGSKGKKNTDGKKDSGNRSSEPKGPCLFWPKRLCRRGTDCPYRHEGPSGSALGSAATTSTSPPAKAAPQALAANKVRAAVALCSVVTAAAGITNPQDNSFALEWALDSGAGEDLSSVGAFENQGISPTWIQEYSTVTSSPLTFETGGGAKASTTTVGFVGNKAGEGMAYMLKNCPYVRSLGKLIQKGFSFFWGPNYEPTLVPPDVPFKVSCDKLQCHVAERVDHCVPIFKETISFTHGMPAASSSEIPMSFPAPDADAPSHDVAVEGHDSPDIESMIRETDDTELVKHSTGPKGVVPSEFKSKDSHVPIPVPKEDSLKVVTSHLKIPVDHLLTHLPAHPGCDVCKEAKLRAKAHKRFANQGSSIRDIRAIEAPTTFLQRICVDHLESAENGWRDERYALVVVDQFTGSLFACPSKSKNQAAVELALRHFVGNRASPVVISDRYPSILAAVKSIGLASDPTPPNFLVKNPLAESAINIIRQGTRAFLLQAGLDVAHWPRAMMCFCYQYDLNTPPSNYEGSLRHESHKHHHSLPAGVEGPEVPLPDVESKLHLALGYQPEPRLLPFGCLVWYLGKIKDPNAPKSFTPNGKPALYLAPEVAPGLRSRDVHLLLDLNLLTSTGQVREIVTRDFVPPSGSWHFPLTRVVMLKQPSRDFDRGHLLRSDPAVPESSDLPRNRSITKRRILLYGQSPECDGCLNGSYSHTQACRQRFNALLDASEPLPRGDGDLDLDVTEHVDDEIHDVESVFRLFDTIIPDDVIPSNPLDEDLVPECPPASPNELHEQHRDDDYSPTSMASSDSTPESWFDDSVIGEVVWAPGGVAKRANKGLFIEFCCKEGSALSKVAEALGISYLGITKESFDVQNDDNFHQLLCWVQEEIQQDIGPIHLWGSLPGAAWSPWQRMALHQYPGYEEKLLAKRAESLELVRKFRSLAELVCFSRGGSSSFAWSKDSEGWDEPEVQDCIDSLGMKGVQFDGCVFDLAFDGKKPKRQWAVQTTNDR